MKPLPIILSLLAVGGVALTVSASSKKKKEADAAAEAENKALAEQRAANLLAKQKQDAILAEKELAKKKETQDSVVTKFQKLLSTKSELLVSERGWISKAIEVVSSGQIPLGDLLLMKDYLSLPSNPDLYFEMKPIQDVINDGNAVFAKYMPSVKNGK